jgi:hypothetical protein
MKNKLFYRFLVVVLICIVAGAVFSKRAFAAFGISYSLTEGGSRLELDPDDSDKGVQISVNTDAATQYEVIQRIVQPLTNRDNPNQSIGDNFVVYGLRGTNQFGDFRIPPNEPGFPVRDGDRLYTSDAAGDSDGFTLIYGIDKIGDINPGYYQGQIAFILRPINSSLSEVTTYLYVYVTVNPGPEAAASVEISGPLGSRMISLNPKKENLQICEVPVKVNGAFKNNFSISQSILGGIESVDGGRLDPRVVNVEVKNVSKGVGISQPLIPGQQVVYTSAPDGQADQDFVITYSLGDLSDQRAGKYTSRINYYLSEGNKPARLINMLDLEIENERVFELGITPRDQATAIEFRNLSAKEGPKINEVDMEIKSNLGKPYQVTQNVFSELTDVEGRVIAFDNFQVVTESLDTKGKLNITQKQKVQKGDTILFVSDKKGSSDKFKIIYELKVPDETIAGNYTSRITYSLVEL